jgi:hypothetical protein
VIAEEEGSVVLDAGTNHPYGGDDASQCSSGIDDEIAPKAKVFQFSGIPI